MTRMSLPTPTLPTARLRLRPFDDADANALFALHSNAYVLRYWDAPPWSERGRAERFITACRQMAEEGTGARLAVDAVSDGAFIGWCGLSRWNPDYRSASLGYCFDEAAWGHGYATEAARALLRWAFDTLDLNRVQAETDTRNVASARVLEKLGFVREGTLREDCVVNGEVSDSWVYGLIRREWRPSSEPVPARFSGSFSFTPEGLHRRPSADHRSPLRSTVWIFHGDHARHASGVFNTLDVGLAWAAEHQVTGILAEYPHGGAYDVAVSDGRFTPSRAHHGTADHVATFSPGLRHVHLASGRPDQ